MPNFFFSTATQALPVSGPLVWLGPPFFSPRLQELGWRVIRANHDMCRPRVWDDILALAGGIPPSVLVAADASLPPSVTGMENFPCLTIFYAVDSHIHSWHPLYGQGFDLCLTSLREHLPSFVKGRLHEDTVRWFPAHARDEHRPPLTAPVVEWDLLFVGTVDPMRAPLRHGFLSEVQKRFSGLHVTSGDFTALYPKAKLVLNECVCGELNFRVFEALGCGSCLLTPDTGPPLTELFADGKELFLYPQHDVSAVINLARHLLDNDSQRLNAAVAGLAAVDAGHRASHRAAALDAWLRELFHSGRAASLLRRRQSVATEIHRKILRPIYLLHAESIDHPELRLAYLRAANYKNG